MQKVEGSSPFIRLEAPGLPRRMFQLQRLRADHEPAVLAFEQRNRAYFSEFVTDRGDDFYARFGERFRALLAEQESGACAFYVLVDEDEEVVGRFNLYDLVDGTAEVGYRVAQQVAGQGVATSALRDLCRIAREQHGLRRLTAGTSEENVASQRVLTNVGFVATGSTEVGGQRGPTYELALTGR